MKEYWFYGVVHDDTISEEKLTDEHKLIIKREREKLNKINLYDNWLGCFINDSWIFKRHGFEVIKIDDDRGNIARKKLIDILRENFKF